MSCIVFSEPVSQIIISNVMLSCIRKATAFLWEPRKM